MENGATPPALPHERLFVGDSKLLWGERRPRVALEDLPKGWQDTKPHPWRRYFARQIDNVVSGLIAEVVLIWALSAVDPELGGRFASLLTTAGVYLQTMIVVALAVLPNALIIGLSGSSIGKWIFGVRVLRPNGKPIGVLRALQREIRVLVMGLGLGIPLISLITVIVSFTGLVEKGSTPWDRDMKNLVAQRPNSFVQIVLSVLGAAAYLSLVAGLIFYRMRAGS